MHMCVYVNLKKKKKHYCICWHKYQFIIVGSGVVGVSVGNQEHLAIGVDAEETQEAILSASYKVSYSPGLELRHSFASRVEF